MDISKISEQMQCPELPMLEKLRIWLKEVELDTSPTRGLESIILHDFQVRELLETIEMIRKGEEDES